MKLNSPKIRHVLCPICSLPVRNKLGTKRKTHSHCRFLARLAGASGKLGRKQGRVK
jgi:hypothetical protein